MNHRAGKNSYGRTARFCARLLGTPVWESLDHTARQQAVLACMTALLGAIAACTSLVFAWPWFSVPLRLVAAISTVLFLSTIVVYRVFRARPWAVTLAHNCIPASLVCSCGFSAIYMAGHFPLAAIYAPAIPLLSVMICSRRAALGWSAVMVSALAAGMFAEPATSAAAMPPWVTLAAGITVLVPTLLSMFLHRQVWEDALQRERAARQELTMSAAKEAELESRVLAEKHSQSLESMARRIAHDLNNFLMGVVGSASLASHSLEKADYTKTAEHLSALMHAAEGAGSLTSSLREYSGTARRPAQPVPVAARIDKALNVASAGFAEPLETTLDCPDELVVDVDPVQFDQVIVNLVRNAGQAYEGPPRPVRVAVSVLKSREPIQCHNPATPLAPGNYVAIAVEDDGEGIAAGDIGRIFAPFVTGRADGRGLGLASASGIVASYGGGIHVASRVGEGTSVRVLLPQAQGTEKVEPLVASVLPGDRRRVLVVDDEVLVREVLQAKLVQIGIDVLLAGDGLEALSTLEQEAVHAVIMDVAMPGLDGISTLAQLRERAARLPVVLMSGHHVHAPHLSRDDFVRTMRKPFSTAQLTAALAELGALDDPPQSVSARTAESPHRAELP